MRPKTKDDAQKIALTLSAPARAALMREAMRRGVSRTQVVEDLVLEFQLRESLPKKGKTAPLTHSGPSAADILNPCGGGHNAPPKPYQKRRAS